MPTRKQRRRQAKSKRHEYEYVYVDEDGNEVEVAEDDVKAERTASRNGRAKPNPRTAQGVRVQPPSWGRVAKRGLIFAPLMFITVMLTSADATVIQQALTTLWLMAIFLPFSYFMDSFMYKRYVKRTGAVPQSKR
ncbi:MAG: hypothetical protein H0T20_05420 [Actinobacteria bacterium]|nr:hypothetical protein [Actinomycetota bacterium]